MKFTKTKSSSVDEIAYDPDNKELHVRWKNTGGIYIYKDVSQRTYNYFLASPSKGKFIASHIHDQHKHEKKS